MRHRPIGIGVQGLADVFALLDIPFDSEEAQEINKLIFETIYHASVERSMEISKKSCKPMKKIAKLHRQGKVEENPEGEDHPVIISGVDSYTMEQLQYCRAKCMN